MSTFGRKIVVAAAAVLLARPVEAAPTTREDAEARRVARDYARCVVREHGDRASDAIMADANTLTIERRYSSLIDSKCLLTATGSAQLRFGADLFRYALADALVNDRLAHDATNTFADRLPLAHLPTPDHSALDNALAKTTSNKERENLQKQYDRGVVVAWLSRYGECVVRQEPVKARYLLLTPPDSAEEISRINDLRPAFSACLNEGTMRVNRTMVRGAIAINYYRLAMATRVPGSAQ